MSSYNVYRHEQLGLEAIKLGFSWPALFFTWAWAFIKRLWGIGIGVFVVSAILGGFLEASLTSGPLWTLIASLAVTVFSICLGSSGNKWRESSMSRRGFLLVCSVDASSSDGAIALALRKMTARKEEGVGHDRPSAVVLDREPSSGTIPEDRSQPDDNAFYDQAWRELEQDAISKGTWARAFSESHGDAVRAKARYITLRVGQLRLAAASEVRVSDLATPAETTPAAVEVDMRSAARLDARQGGQAKAHSRSELDLSDWNRVRASRQGQSRVPALDAAEPDREHPHLLAKKLAHYQVVIAVLITGGLIMSAVYLFAEGEHYPPSAGPAVVSEPNASEYEEAAAEKLGTSITTTEAPPSDASNTETPGLVGEDPIVDSAPPKERAGSIGADAPSGAAALDLEDVAKKERVWEQTYKPSAACIEPADWEVYVQCVNARMSARNAFERQWARGEYRSR